MQRFASSTACLSVRPDHALGEMPQHLLGGRADLGALDALLVREMAEEQLLGLAHLRGAAVLVVVDGEAAHPLAVLGGAAQSLVDLARAIGLGGLVLPGLEVHLAQLVEQVEMVHVDLRPLGHFLVAEVAVDAVGGAALPAYTDQFPRLEMLLKDFASQTPISINTAKQLAEMMAGKAVIIKDIMGNALVADKEAGISTELTDQYEGFKTSLIHDITIADFADVYAETIAYGLFAARLHDTSIDTFNRAEALELLPKSNPFLRNLFVYIAGPNLDDRLRRMIDDLCDVFRACDVGALMQDFGKFTARNDPFLHFYETFLAEYNPAKRKARGVWYTPEPVVNFIVRAVDDVLKTEFGLPMGLADTSKISIDWDSGQNDAKGKPVMTKKDVHRVQILDPATGTGTFLAEAIKQIAAQVKDVAPAMWSSYVERDLIPRLHGFELLMASYAMCHMKLDMMLTDMGYKPSATPPRLGVYLTNSLEEGERVEQTLPFARWLSEEAKGANTIKRDTPIMCVIGNPPYSGESANKGEWIMGLMEAYKKEPGGKAPLERT